MKENQIFPTSEFFIGSRTFVRCPNPRKLDERGEEEAFEGLSDTQNASRLYVTSPPPRIIVSHDVKVDETLIFQKSPTSFSLDANIKNIKTSPTKKDINQNLNKTEHDLTSNERKHNKNH